MPLTRLQKEILTDFRVFHKAGFDLAKSKQRDYGPRNIGKLGLHGVVVRMFDKMERLRHLVLDGKTPSNESIEDTLMDMQNYSTIGLMCQRKIWPKFR